MKKLQCAKCEIVFWTDLELNETLISRGEWIKSTCPKCGAEWAIVEAGEKAPKISRRRAKLLPKYKPIQKEAPAERTFSFTGPRLKSLRRKLGLSQRDLAKLIDVTPWAIVSWEKGRFSPRKDRITKLSELASKSKEEVRTLLTEKNPLPKEKKKHVSPQI